MNVCILYGIFEGSWHGKRLRLALSNQGFGISDNSSEADIIIAHSGGCLLIPTDAKARLILLVGLPYWSVNHF